MIRRAGPRGLWVVAAVAVLLLLGLHVEAFRPSSSGPQRPLLLLHPSTALATQVAAAGTHKMG